MTMTMVSILELRDFVKEFSTLTDIIAVYVSVF